MKTQSRLDHYTILKKLGSGFSGKVKLGQDVNTGKQYALKIVSGTATSAEKITDTLKREWEIAQKLTHNSIIKLIDLRFDGRYTSRRTGKVTTKVYAVMELAPKGEIFDVLFYAGAFDENLARFYFKQLVGSVEHLHNNGVAHRDLKPENLLLDDHLMLKLIDFGFATVVEEGRRNRTSLGTLRYMAPELLYKLPYDAKKADIFAMGVILFVFFTGHPPFKHATENDPHYFNLFVKNTPMFWQYHSQQGVKREYSHSFQKLVNGMLHFQASERFSIDQVKNSEWLNTPVNLNNAIKSMQTYMRKMHCVVDGNNEVNYVPISVKGYPGPSTIQPHQKVVIKDIELNEAEDFNANVKYDIRVQLDSKADFVRLLISAGRQINAEAYQENKRCRLRIPADEASEATTIEFALFKFDDNFFGANMSNVDSDYFDFCTHKAKLINGILNRFATIESKDYTDDIDSEPIEESQQPAEPETKTIECTKDSCIRETKAIDGLVSVTDGQVLPEKEANQEVDDKSQS